MKKFLLSLFGLACLGTASADTYMHVDLKDRTVSYNADDVVEVTFEERKIEEEHGVSVSGVHDGYEYIDLGLESGIMWATYNLGAKNPQDFGNHYAWGETEAKDSYLWENYKWMKKGNKVVAGNTLLIKYTSVETSTHEDYEMDNIFTLLPEDDAVAVNWKGDWRMASTQEFKEMVNVCEFEPIYDENDKKIGFEATSSINGNKIYFPISGVLREDNRNEDIAYYWTSTLSPNQGNFDGESFWAHNLRFISVPRYCGCSVRAVFQGERKPQEPQTYMIVRYKSEGSDSAETKEYLLDDVKDVRFEEVAKSFSVKFLDMDGALIESQKVDEGKSAVAPEVPVVCGYKFKGWDKSFENVKSDLIVNAVYDELDVEVVNGHEFVDLGLPSGTKWAKYNIGATKSDIFGEAYSWGYGTKDNNIFDLYDKGGLDSNGDLIPSYDIATQLWGENCKMPTKADFEELLAYCDWELTTMYGEKGYKVSSKSSVSDGCNCIFFPIKYIGVNFEYLGAYWSSSTDSDRYIYALSATENEVEIVPIVDEGIFWVRPIVGKASVTIAKTFSVKFLDMDGVLIESQKVDEGNSAVAPEVPVVCGYKFKGWDKSFENVKSDLIVNAVYDELDVEVVNGHEFVDLGLPSGTKWAKYNIGATKSDIFGEAYSWGYGTKDNNISDLYDKGGLDSNGDLIPSYDIATQLWGENCKMPTKADFEELLAYCDWEWTTMYGEKGYKVSSKSSVSDGCNCIFFPTMYTTFGMEIGEDFEYWGTYWSSSSDSYGEIYYLGAFDNRVEIISMYDTYLQSLAVRPILKQK